MKQSWCLFSGVILLVFLLSPPDGQTKIEAPNNPSSAKECAICHYRWIDTFFLFGRGSELVPYQAEKVEARVEMCFSCHDGSVADSRARVYNDRHHPVNKPPPAKMEIPKIFPLDENGNMQCATCHTAHGVSSEMGMEKTIFLRATNDDSGMCRQCHKDKDGGTAKGNHPIDTTAIAFTPELRKHGAVEGERANQVVCESCHRVHGAPNDRFLIEKARDDGQLCLECHQDKKGLIDTVHDLRVSAPSSTNVQGKTPAESGVCGVCHLVHGSKELLLWARKIPGKPSGNKSVDLCRSCHRPGGLAPKDIPLESSHPCNVAVKGQDIDPALPFFNTAGKRVARKEGLLTCPTCHDPHQGRKVNSKGNPGKGDPFLRYANKPSPELCRQCHPRQSLVESTDHDLLAVGSTSVNKRGQTPAESGTCGVCHLIHRSGNEHLWAREGGTTSQQPAEAACLTCHNPEGAAPAKVLGKVSHPVNIDPGKRQIATTLPLFNQKGENSREGEMTCQTCHNPHRWDPQNDKVGSFVGHEGNGTNSFLRAASAPAPALCANCHADKSLVWKTDHDMNIVAPESTNLLGQSPAEAGTCGSCHLVHNGRIKPRLWARQLKKGNALLDAMCKSCHDQDEVGANKVPKADSHPAGLLITNVGRDVKGQANYFPLFQRRTGEKVSVGDIGCASCHDVHRWDPRLAEPGSGKNLEGNTTNSFLRMQTYSLMCIDCHGLDALFRFKYYHNSKQRGAAAGNR